MMTDSADAALKVYVGCAPPQHVAAQVLAHSILRHASLPVEILRLDDCLAGQPVPASGHTLFSLQRFFIPQLSGHHGLAVYLDSDMLVFHDLCELLELRAVGSAVSSAEAPPESGRRRQFSVMVIDCALARWDPVEIHRLAQQRYREVMTELEFEPSKTVCLPYTWNSLERFEPGKTRLLHFTAMNLQPWLSSRNPLAPVWMDALFLALQDHFVSADAVRDGIRQGWFRPGLLWQVEHGERDPRQLPLRLRLAEAVYRPPHRPALLTAARQRLTRALKRA